MTDQCRVFNSGDPEPGPEVLAVRDRDSDLWRRVEGGWVCRKPDGSPAAWHAVLATMGPLMDCTSEITGAQYLDEILDALPTPRYKTFAAAQAAGFPDENGSPTVRGASYRFYSPHRRDPAVSFSWSPCEECNGTGTGGEDMDTCPECGGAAPLIISSMPMDHAAVFEGVRRNYEAMQRRTLDEFAAAYGLHARAWSTYELSQSADNQLLPRPISPGEITGIVQSRWEPSPPSTDLVWLDEAPPRSDPPSLHQVLADVEAQPLERDLDTSTALATAIKRGWVKIDRGGRFRRRRARLTELGKRQLRRFRSA
jgi:hypothetical protein